MAGAFHAAWLYTGVPPMLPANSTAEES